MDRGRLGFGVTNVLVAGLVLLGVFRGLPARYAPVDAGAIVLALALSAAGAAMLANHRGYPRIARVASAIVLALGLALVGALAITASWLSGVYGPVGKGGALLYVFVLALVLPYVVVFPIAQLLWLGAKKE
jgi:hypothetical protein